jgi:hypothetical protein
MALTFLLAARVLLLAVEGTLYALSNRLLTFGASVAESGEVSCRSPNCGARPFGRSGVLLRMSFLRSVVVTLRSMRIAADESEEHSLEALRPRLLDVGKAPATRLSLLALPSFLPSTSLSPLFPFIFSCRGGEKGKAVEEACCEEDIVAIATDTVIRFTEYYMTFPKGNLTEVPGSEGI